MPTGKKERDSLVGRWSEEAVRCANRSLKSGAAASPFGSLPDGFLDLRGLDIREFNKNVNLAEVDLAFSRTTLAGQFSRCKVTRCRFQDVLFETNLGDVFTDCDFSHAKMSSSTFSGKFVRCDFTSTNLMSANGELVLFQECVFAHTNFRGTMFGNCIFDSCMWKDCRFGCGSFAGSAIRGPRPAKEDLGNHIMDRVRFEDGQSSLEHQGAPRGL